MEVDWSGATLWFGDERCVPPDDELSNYGMAKEALLDRLPDSAAGSPTVRRGWPRGPHAGADDYERELRETLGEEMPRLDLVLLGLGPDAHVASLFPGQKTLNVKDRLAVGVEQAGWKPYVPRVSLTLPVMDGARSVVFLVAGRRPTPSRGPSGASPRPTPRQRLVRPTSGDLVLLSIRAPRAGFPATGG